MRGLCVLLAGSAMVNAAAAQQVDHEQVRTTRRVTAVRTTMSILIHGATGRLARGDVPGRTALHANRDAGLDLKYGVGLSLTLDASYRTDFSQVEVDQPRRAALKGCATAL